MSSIVHYSSLSVSYKHGYNICILVSKFTCDFKSTDPAEDIYSIKRKQWIWYKEKHDSVYLE